MKTILTPFNLEAAKAGAKVVCRDGTPAKFLTDEIAGEEDSRIEFLVAGLMCSFSINGIYDLSRETNLDLFVELEIPDDFIPYDPDVLPPEDAEEIEMMYENGDKVTKHKHWFILWDEYNNIIGKTNPRIAYRITKRKETKLEGEVWAVVRMQKSSGIDSQGLSLFASLDKALLHCAEKQLANKILAIFKPFETGGKWKQGDGLELLNGDVK